MQNAELRMQNGSEGAVDGWAAAKRHFAFCIFHFAFFLLLGATVSWLSCSSDEGKISVGERGAIVYPPSPQMPRVVALGNLRTTAPPSDLEVRLTDFFFGAAPEAPMAILRPSQIAVRGEGLLIVDDALNVVLAYALDRAEIGPLTLSPPPERAVSIAIAGDDAVLVTDLEGGGVLRYDASGRQGQEYTLSESSGAFRPAASLSVGDEVWVSNCAGHRIEIFDAQSGDHKRSIGERGSGPGQFAMPLGLALGPDGDVYVVDGLNNRVQVFGADGGWKRIIGRAGDRVGCFGRPRDVAVGPDGTVFVSDAATQRIHAFDAHGRALLAFGEPGPGAGALAMPGGIRVTTDARVAPRTPVEFEAAYYVLVCERYHNAGVRVYACGGSEVSVSPESSPPATPGRTTTSRLSALAANPHWSAQSCSACHAMREGRPAPIAAAEVDGGCLSCHDGKRASSEAHPIGRPAVTQFVQTPADWPTVGGRIGCLTCHDIRRHCDSDVSRPDENPAMLRSVVAGGAESDHGATAALPRALAQGFEPVGVAGGLDFCLQCHKWEDQWRFNPHEQVDSDGRINHAACSFCHSRSPAFPVDRRWFKPNLRAGGSDLCMTCHPKHWDYFPEGHVDRAVPEEIKRRMLAMQHFGREPPVADGPAGASDPVSADAADASGEAHSTPERPRNLPLDGDRIRCYTCHNPHEAGLFEPNSELGMVASAPEDEAVSLRMNYTQLCLTCHRK